MFEDPEFPIIGRWVRPKDICENPHFLITKASQFDVQQGKLSACWFMSAVASLTLNEKLFNRVVCDDNSFDKNYAGIIHFRYVSFLLTLSTSTFNNFKTGSGNTLNG